MASDIAFSKPLSHALARVEEQAKADGHTLGAEMRHLLRHIVFEELKILLAEVRYESATAIADGRGHVDQLDAALELESVTLLRTLRTRRTLSTHHNHERDRGHETAQRRLNGRPHAYAR